MTVHSAQSPRWALCSGVLTLTSLLAFPLPAQRASTKDVAASATPATVTIITLDAEGDTLAQGSGFFVSASGLLLTNWHVLRGATRAVVARASGPRYERVSFVGGDSALDLAVLKVTGYGLPYLKTRQTTPSVGEMVMVIGSPLGMAATVSTGIVSALRTERGREIVQISAPISPGSSGGAVLDAAGQVFAVATWRMRGGEQMNFAVPVRFASGWLTGTLSERSLASVFGASTSLARREESSSRPVPQTPSSPRRSPREATSWPPLSVPARHTRPSRAISGTFSLTVEVYWDSLDLRVRQEGLLVADELLDGFGVMVLSRILYTPQDTGLAPLDISFIRSLRRTADGRVMLDDPGTAVSGYQTADGFFAIGGGRDTDGDHYVLRVRAKEAAVALSRDFGLYDATWESRWKVDTARTQSTRTLQWVGGVAAITFNDSLYLSVGLQNESGGNTVFKGKGALSSDGTFSLAQSDGSWLQGSVRAGVLVGEFRDQRDDGYFLGTLRAKRK